MSSELRIDPFLGTKVHIVGGRKNRPNRPTVGCPFCVGGREAPEPYDVISFPNRWPALGEGRCEVVLYSSIHDATLPSLGVDATVRLIDLWAERTEALGSLDDVDYVLIFENRGAAVGATIEHPHGQIYAYDHVPDRPSRRLTAHWQPDENPGDRSVSGAGDWNSYVPFAPTYPIELTLAPATRVGSLAELDEIGRRNLAELLVDSITRLDALFDEPLPFMMWLNQAPSNSNHPEVDSAWLNIEIVSPWRAKGVARFIAAAEVAANEYFHEVQPEELAERLRKGEPTSPGTRTRTQTQTDS